MKCKTAASAALASLKAQTDRIPALFAPQARDPESEATLRPSQPPSAASGLPVRPATKVTASKS